MEELMKRDEEAIIIENKEGANHSCGGYNFIFSSRFDSYRSFNSCNWRDGSFARYNKSSFGQNTP